jgi:hypothetical protein
MNGRLLCYWVDHGEFHLIWYHADTNAPFLTLWETTNPEFIGGGIIEWDTIDQSRVNAAITEWSHWHRVDGRNCESCQSRYICMTTEDIPAIKRRIYLHQEKGV